MLIKVSNLKKKNHIFVQSNCRNIYTKSSPCKIKKNFILSTTVDTSGSDHKKYGVIVLDGITRSWSGTALKSLASRLSASLNLITAAMLPHL